jgi:hypothetical protein
MEECTQTYLAGARPLLSSEQQFEPNDPEHMKLVDKQLRAALWIRFYLEHIPGPGASILYGRFLETCERPCRFCWAIDASIFDSIRGAARRRQVNHGWSAARLGYFCCQDHGNNCDGAVLSNRIQSWRTGAIGHCTFSLSQGVDAFKQRAAAAQAGRNGMAYVGRRYSLVAALCVVVPYLHQIWSAPAQLFISVGLLYNIVGPSVFAGMLLMVLLIPANTWIAQQQAQLNRQIMKIKDEVGPPQRLGQSLKLSPNSHILLALCHVRHLKRPILLFSWTHSES